jgi:hypothetical protein
MSDVPPRHATTLQRIFRCGWLVCLGLFVAVCLYPVSSRVTRLAAIVFLAVIWFGAGAFLWRLRAGRAVWIIITLFFAAVTLWPSDRLPPPDTLRADYIHALQRYTGARYYWGGENWRGIDCSGLIRRGMIDALATRGVKDANPALLRLAMQTWWNDTTARAMGEAGSRQTIPVGSGASINALDTTALQPGDLGIVEHGIHIMAYLGNGEWIEADPGIGRVVRMTPPVKNNGWFASPVIVARWQILAR